MPLAIRIDAAHQGLRGRLLAPASVPRARSADARDRAGRGLRLPRPERRRQDDDAQAADAAASTRPSGRAEILGRPGRRRRGAPAHRLPAREPVLLRLPDGRGAARRISPACSATRRPSGGARVARCSTRSASARERRLPAPEVLEGDDPARRHRAGAPQRSGASSSSTSRCRASIRSAAATCAR